MHLHTSDLFSRTRSSSLHSRWKWKRSQDLCAKPMLSIAAHDELQRPHALYERGRWTKTKVLFCPIDGNTYDETKSCLAPIFFRNPRHTLLGIRYCDRELIKSKVRSESFGGFRCVGRAIGIAAVLIRCFLDHAMLTTRTQNLYSYITWSRLPPQRMAARTVKSLLLHERRIAGASKDIPSFIFSFQTRSLRPPSLYLSSMIGFVSNTPD